MKKVLLFLSIIFCLTTTLSAQKIFKTTNLQEANIKVFVASTNDSVDLNVKIVANISDVNKDGLWYMTELPEEADLKIYFTQVRSQADMVISYVTTEEQAGWLTKNKRYLFKTKK